MSSNYRVRLWTIIGESAVGKSPTIRSLISCPSEVSIRPPDTSQILLRGGGYLDVFARIRAVQEARWDPAAAVTAVDNYAAKIQTRSPPISAGWINVLFAMRLDPLIDASTKPSVVYPSAEVYLSHFVNCGWSLERLVLMAPEDRHNHLSRFGAPTCWIDDSTNAAEANGRVRNHFGWA